MYPPSIYASLPSTGENKVSHPPVMHLRTLLTSREPRHRRGFWIWMAIAPLTVPFMLVRESSRFVERQIWRSLTPPTLFSLHHLPVIIFSRYT